MIIILIGVCGSGKTTVGEVLAEKLHWSFADADEFHSEENKRKMSSSQPLTDQDRLPWLLNIHSYIQSALMKTHSAVLTCSALKKIYRQILLHGETFLPDCSPSVLPGLERESCLYAGPKGENHKNTQQNLSPYQRNESLQGESVDFHGRDSLHCQKHVGKPCINDVVFVHLSGTFEVLERRLKSRKGHFMPASLLQSQLDTLEPPDQDENSITVDVDKTVDEVVVETVEKLGLSLVETTRFGNKPVT